jgi:adenylyltransferase/sulfurtransferase
MQALEAIKLILGVGEPLIGRLVLFDALRMRFRELQLRKDPDCPICGPRPSITGLIDYEAFCGIGSTAASAEAEISPAELQAALESGREVAIVDVREPHEFEIAHLPGSILIPLRELPARLAQLESRSDLVVLCHHGMRSLQAVELLRGAGFQHARSLAGGIDAWAAEIDPSLARY